MQVPIVCFVTFNRLGLTVKNLTALLKSTDDFELHIVDNNSTDDTWKYIRGIKDKRMKSRKRFNINYGVVYAINYVLSKRKKDQYFILIENDVCIETQDFVTKFMETMDTFQDVGLLGCARKNFFEQKGIKPKKITQKGLSYYKYDMIIGCFNCIRPEVFDYIGYWNEETYAADQDMSSRINKYTPYVTGYAASIELNQTQYISCDQCLYRKECSLINQNRTCFNIHRKNYSHDKFAESLQEKKKMYYQQLRNGKRTIYCASIHDTESMRKHYYDIKMAHDNFNFFKKNGN
ncbi:glycosyl transferase [Vallitalea longa]|uniref:Glycosyl transferase n=2 Tax=Vallitalea longa TaxID=2936439 RepID=A0A9W5YF60_9FIRM|nr:glycosyl transferase [Vallitalea longa]